MSGVEEQLNITPLEWAIEKVRWQNPRIRVLLGCVRSLDSVLESNFAILHCSPKRLLQIWDTVRTVCWIVQTKFTPLMEQPSSLAELDEAVRNARDSLTFFEDELFAELDQFPHVPKQEQHDQLRRTLCITIGKLHGFLVNTLGEILAADPRSEHDVDYFLARKFPRDVEEAEWLQTSVKRLHGELERLNARRDADLGSVIDGMASSGRLPSADEWDRVTAFLVALEADFARELKSIAGLRAIRIGELEVLQTHARDLTESCRVAGELHTTALAVLDKLTAIIDRTHNHTNNEVAADVERVMCLRIATCLRALEDELRDLAAFIPLWLSNLEKRRALMLRPDGEEEQDLETNDDS